MQIEDGLLVKFLAWVFAGITGLLATLYWYIWRGDRRRLKTLEEKMAHAITKPEVDAIVNRVESNFRDEHQNIINAINRSHNELRQDIRDIRSLFSPWNGNNRRDE